MSKRSKIKKAIDDLEREIEVLEQKRERSQTAVIRALITNTKASQEDVQYFLMFSSLIDNDRESLRKLYAELDSFKKK